jgi:cytochrome b6-f complex iron-sulfur subunit
MRTTSGRRLPTVTRAPASSSLPLAAEGIEPGILETTHPVDRATFLRTAGSAALLAALGITLPGCSDSTPVSPSLGPGTGPITPPATDDGGGTAGLSLSGSTLSVDLTVEGFTALQQSGQWALLVRRVGDRNLNLLLVNVDGARIRAFSSICPHAGCNTSWQYSASRFRCTCHDSIFENSGRRVSGPANRDLTEYPATRTGNTLAVTLT